VLSASAATSEPFPAATTHDAPRRLEGAAGVTHLDVPLTRELGERAPSRESAMHRGPRDPPFGFPKAGTPKPDRDEISFATHAACREANGARALRADDPRWRTVGRERAAEASDAREGIATFAGQCAETLSWLSWIFLLVVLDNDGYCEAPHANGSRAVSPPGMRGR
jgi:hypothetical protein